MSFRLPAIFEPDQRQDGVRRIHIYLLRLIYILMFVFLGKTTWMEIFTHQGAWEPQRAVAWCAWTGFATIAGLGIIHPLRMLPILLLEIIYKVLWLVVVAWPLWSAGTLAGSPAEGITQVFLPVVLVIAAVPWGYVVKHYVRPARHHQTV